MHHERLANMNDRQTSLLNELEEKESEIHSGAQIVTTYFSCLEILDRYLHSEESAQLFVLAGDYAFRLAIHGKIDLSVVRSYLKRAAARDPFNTDLLTLSAKLHIAERLPADAVCNLKNAITLSPSVERYLELVDAYRIADRNSDAAFLIPQVKSRIADLQSQLLLSEADVDIETASDAD